MFAQAVSTLSLHMSNISEFCEPKACTALYVLFFMTMGYVLQGKDDPTKTAANYIRLQHVPTTMTSNASSDLETSSPSVHRLSDIISDAVAAATATDEAVSTAAEQAASKAVEEATKQLPEEEDFSATGLDKKRRMVVEAAAHSWRGYEEHAWGCDELQPLTQDGKETLGGLGATIVDSLDTLWLMGLKDQFGRSA